MTRQLPFYWLSMMLCLACGPKPRVDSVDDSRPGLAIAFTMEMGIITDDIGEEGDLVDWKVLKALPDQSLQGLSVEVLLDNQDALILVTLLDADQKLIATAELGDGTAEAKLDIDRETDRVLVEFRALRGETLYSFIAR